MTSRTLLVLGHPGHELRMWQWVCQEKPVICVLTDGSGAGGQSRLSVTEQALESAGVHFSSRFTSVSDVQIYKAVLEQDLEFFVNLATQVRNLLLGEQFEVVVGDASEGYNPTHDICRLLIDSAVASAAHHGRRVLNYSFPLMGHPNGNGTCNQDITLMLNEDQWQQKINLILAYGTEAGGMLSAEIADTFNKFGKQAFKQESLFLMPLMKADARLTTDKPFYERHGELRVAEGVYRHVIRYNEHIYPIHQRLLVWVKEASTSPCEE